MLLLYLKKFTEWRLGSLTIYKILFNMSDIFCISLPFILCSCSKLNEKLLGNYLNRVK